MRNCCSLLHAYGTKVKRARTAGAYGWTTSRLSQSVRRSSKDWFGDGAVAEWGSMLRCVHVGSLWYVDTTRATFELTCRHLVDSGGQLPPVRSKGTAGDERLLRLPDEPRQEVVKQQTCPVT